MARIPTAQDAGIGGPGTLPVQPVPVRNPVTGTPIGATPEAFGAGIGRGLRNIAAAGQQFGGTLQDIATDIQIEQTEREAKEADLEYSKRLREAMFGDGTPENPGFYGLEGKAAVDGHSIATANLEKIRQEIAQGMTNERARQMFSQASAARMDQEIERISVHTFKQGKVAAQDASEARRAEFIDDGVARYNDPKAVEQLVAAGAEEVMSFELDRGTEEAVALNRMQEFTTLFHTAIIERHLATDDYLAAQAYFDDHIDQIDGRAHAGILEDIAQSTTTKVGGLKRDVRQYIAGLNSGATPAGLETVKAQVDAIPVGLDASFDNLRQDFYEAMGDAPIVASYLKKPLGEVEDFLATFRARKSSAPPDERPTIEELRRFEKIEKAHAEQMKMFNDGDGLIVAANNGVIPPLDPINFLDRQQLEGRVTMAQIASEAYGVDISPLTDGEVDQFIGEVTGAGSAEPPAIADVSEMLANLNSSLGENAANFLVRDVIEKNHPSLGVALLISDERPKVAQDILRGQRFLLENKEFQPTKEQTLTAGGKVYGNLFTKDTAQARGDLNAAAASLYAVRAQEAGATAYNPATHEQAIREVLGGILRHNGRNIIPPFPDMEQSDFDAIMLQVTNETLADANGELPKHGDGTDFTAEQLQHSFWRDEAQLVSVDMQGTYQLLIPGVGYIQNSDGSGPYELNLRDLTGTQVVTPGQPTPDFGASFLDALVEAETLFQQRQAGQQVDTAIANIPAPGAEAVPALRPSSLSASRFFTAQAEINFSEGIPTKMYKDSRGIPTIGVGYNLNKPGAAEEISALGYNYQAVLSGKQEITEEDASTLYQRDYAEAQNDAAAVVPGFDLLNSARKAVFTDMIFNLGRENFLEFEDMLSAIATQDWETAADEAEDSTWFKQVGRRGPRNVAVIRTGQLQGY